MRTWKFAGVAMIGAIAVTVFAAAACTSARADDPKGGEVPRFLRLAAVTRGDVGAVVSATGTVEPETMVDVGPEVSGTIRKLGPDPRGKTDPLYRGKSIDFGSPVEAGDVLARSTTLRTRSR